jgi:hypothetical protein
LWASEQHHGVQSGLWIERHTAAEPHFRLYQSMNAFGTV